MIVDVTIASGVYTTGCSYSSTVVKRAHNPIAWMMDWTCRIGELDANWIRYCFDTPYNDLRSIGNSFSFGTGGGAGGGTASRTSWLCSAWLLCSTFVVDGGVIDGREF